MSSAYEDEKKGDDGYIQDSVHIGESELTGPSVRDGNRPVKFFVFLTAFMAAFGGLMFGYDIGGSGGTLVMPAFRKNFEWPPGECCPAGPTPTANVDYCMRYGCPTAEYDCLATDTVYDGNVINQCVEGSWEYNRSSETAAQGWISMLFTLGCFAGAITTSWQTEYFGRKRSLMIHDIIFVIGATMQMTAPSMGVMYAGRFIGGIGIGSLSMIIPLYQSEMAPEHIRGKLVSLQQLCITLGIVIAAALNIAFKSMEEGWRFSYGGNISFAVVMFFAMIMLPDSPRWLMQEGRVDDARKVFMKLRYPDEVEDEIQQISNQIETEKEIGTGTWSQVFGKENNMRYRTFIGAALQFFQQCTGINAIMFFAPDILNTFFSEGVALYGNLGIMIFNFLSTFICIYLIDKTGRITLLFYGCIGMAIGLLGCSILASPLLDYKNSEVTGVFILIFCMFYVANFAYSWGPIIWVVCSEFYPQNLRSKCMSISTATNWGVAAIVGKATPYLYKENSLDLWGTFLLFLAFVITMCFFMYTSVPETAGVVLEDTDQLFIEFKRGFSRRPTSVNHLKTRFG